MQAMPGDPIELLAGERVSPEKIAQLKAQWGLDKPVYMQYFYWLSRIIRGDFGRSMVTKLPVIELIKARLPYTLLLTGSALIVEYVIAIPLGLLAALKWGSKTDHVVVTLSIVLWSMPSFWLGVLLMIIFAIKLNLLPLSGYSGLKSLILPLLTLSLPSLAGTLRLTRSEVLEVLREDYVLTAYAKGLPKYKVLIKHVLRNALVPVTVMFFLYLPWLIGGAVIVETVFAWPGMGRLLWKSITVQDYPVVQAIIFIIALLTVISNTIGDIVSAVLDPRIREAL
ncbi:MAG TPA: ABC transporter permease [candidate division WOR-3 bacterium]|uniref:ABC transporter permease n=1 Tax=candidate division WOR-3 bacterium TaxID=2052148 RepID=A0A7V0LV52_UNCW3|nr:ABC transporter permease [candidate division WOR-3 bacterium]